MYERGDSVRLVVGPLDTHAATGAPNDTTLMMAYVKELVVEMVHETYIFPESTANVCILTGHANANTWSSWAEIADDQGVPDTLSSKFASAVGHLSATVIEDLSATSTLYMVELAYGDDKTIISRHRVLSETNKLPTMQVSRARASGIPAGETVYARVMCAAGGESLNVHFRYHLHV